MRFLLRNRQLKHYNTSSTSTSTSSKPIDELRKRRVIHKVLPWIESPLRGVDQEDHVFAQRHEANALELFFDLFFVANLATFTTYHAVTSWTDLAAYIGFFVIIWETWFQITLHDTRFARDSIYERTCKTAQMIAFVGFALVASDFNPGAPDVNMNNFKLLSWVLFVTRLLLAAQYSVVIAFIPKSGSTRLLVPLCLNVATYVCTAIVFGAMTTGFVVGKTAGIVGLWWGAMALETISVMTTTMVWRKLSFKKTHLVERMGLLSLIVIGEGAIGATKTISAVSSKGLSVENFWLVICIVLILISLWMFYFDHQPHGHYGTLREQVWALLHFPVHLSIVGIVEGAQQILRSRYGYKQTTIFDNYFMDYCFKQNLDGPSLSSKLINLIYTFKLTKKAETLVYVPELLSTIYSIGNQTGICSNQTSLATANYYTDTMPTPLRTLKWDFHGTLYVASGTKLKPDDPARATSLESFEVVYVYFMGSFFILLGSMMVWLSLMRKHRADASDWISQTVRATALIIFAVLLTLAVKDGVRVTIMRKTPAVLPVAAGVLLIIVITDRVGTYVANKRNPKWGETMLEDEEVAGTHSDLNSRAELKISPTDSSRDNIPVKKTQRQSDSTWGTYPSYPPSPTAPESQATPGSMPIGSHPR